MNLLTENVVHISGGRGKPPTDQYKVCATYVDGYRLTAVCVVGGPKAAEKARKSAQAILKRYIIIDLEMNRFLSQLTLNLLIRHSYASIYC